jgi:hypothetical protein
MLRLLTLLLMLPTMLMPPGMCVCRIVSVGTASVAPRSASSDRLISVAHAANPRSDCTCESCRSRAAVAVPERGDDQPSRLPSDPGPVKHWPGCPAAADAVPITMTVPVVTVPTDFVDAAVLLAPPAKTTIPPVRVASVPTPFAARPLFISHCSLLI